MGTIGNFLDQASLMEGKIFCPSANLQHISRIRYYILAMFWMYLKHQQTYNRSPKLPYAPYSKGKSRELLLRDHKVPIGIGSRQQVHKLPNWIQEWAERESGWIKVAQDSAKVI